MRQQVATAALVLTGCAGALDAPQTPSADAPDISFQGGIQLGLVAHTIDDNTVRVVLTDAGEVSIGQCANAFGNALVSRCFENPTATVGDSGLSPTRAESLRAKLLNKGIFSQYSSAISREGSVGGSAFGSSISGESRGQRYQIVYEWSRYATATMSPPPPAGFILPLVASADFGFAVRLILDVRIQNTESTAKLNLGPAQLEAALALGVAEVSVRYQVLGSTAEMLPKDAYKVRSYEDVKEALGEFHAAAKVLADAWKANCLGGAGEKTIAEQANCPVTPVMLAYYAKGPDIGINYSERRDLQGECDKAKAVAIELRARKAAAEDAKLSDSDWRKFLYAQSELARCQDVAKDLAARNRAVLDAVSRLGANPEAVQSSGKASAASSLPAVAATGNAAATLTEE